MKNHLWKPTRRALPVLALCIFCGAGAVAYGDAVVVVVNKSFPTDSMTQRELKNIFEGRKAFTADNQRLKPLLLPKDSPASTPFFKDVLGTSQSRFHRNWVAKLLSGKGSPPKKMKSQEDVIEEVQGNTSAIGYIEAAKATRDIKILNIKK
ncbi:MAG: hypothetical protein AAF492_25610 [Verrucomicrobiota bacterium]